MNARTRNRIIHRAFRTVMRGRRGPWTTFGPDGEIREERIHDWRDGIADEMRVEMLIDLGWFPIEGDDQSRILEGMMR